MLNNSTWHCCSYLWTTTIKQNTDFKAVKRSLTDEVMVVLEHKSVQQTHLLALQLETFGNIPRFMNAFNGLVYFLIIDDTRGDSLMEMP